MPVSRPSRVAMSRFLIFRARRLGRLFMMTLTREPRVRSWAALIVLDISVLTLMGLVLPRGLVFRSWSRLTRLLINLSS